MSGEGANIFQILFSNTWGIVLVILLFGGSIFIHELGHFLAARWRGLKVERFSIGFGPRLFGWKGKDGVDYRVSLFPLGGYVALPQLADMRAIEGEPKEEQTEMPPISYADKMYVVGAGPLFNILFAFVLAFVIWGVGRPSSEQEQTTVIGYVVPTLDLDETTTVASPAYKAGLQAGDRVLAVDGNPVHNFSRLTKEIVTGSGRDELGNPKAVFEIERDGEIMVLDVYPELRVTNLRSRDRMRNVGIMPAYSLVVESVVPYSPAALGDLQPGDHILSVNGETYYSLPSLNHTISNNAGNPLTFQVERDGEPLNLVITPQSIPFTQSLAGIRDPENPEQMLRIIPTFEETPASPLLGDSTLAAQGFIVFDVPPGNSAFREFSVGDRIVSANNQSPDSLQSLIDVVNEPQDEAPSLQVQGMLGLDDIPLPAGAEASFIPPQERIITGFTVTPGSIIVYPDPLTQFRDNIDMTFSVLGSLLSRHSDIGINHLMGPIGIGRVLHTFSIEDVRLALWFTVLVNINLAILNLLPIPVLDGGHMVIATLGKLRGKNLPPSVIAGAQGTFMLLLMGLMFYIIFYDSLRWAGDREADRREEVQSLYYVPPTFPGNKDPE